MGAPATSLLPEVSSTLSLELYGLTNERLTEQLEPERDASHQTAKAVLHEIFSLEENIREQARKLNMEVDIPPVRLPQEPRDRTSGQLQPLVRELLTSYLSGIPKSRALYARTQILELFSIQGEKTPIFNATIAKGNAQDVRDFFAIHSDLKDVPEDLDDPAKMPGQIWEWICELKLRWYKQPVPSAKRREARGALAAHVTKAEQMCTAIFQRKDLLTLVQQKNFWNRMHPHLQSIVLELQSLSAYLENPGREELPALQGRIEALKQSFLSAERHLQAMEERTASLERRVEDGEWKLSESKASLQAARGENGRAHPIVSVGHGSTKLEEDKRKLDQSRKERTKAQQRHQARTRELQTERQNLLDFDPRAVRQERIDEIRAGILESAVAIAKDTEQQQDIREFLERKKQTTANVTNEVVMEHAREVLDRLPEWILDLFTQEIEIEERYAQRAEGKMSRFKALLSACQEEVERGRRARMEGVAIRLAVYLREFDKDLRAQVAEYIRQHIDPLQIQVPADRRVGMVQIQYRHSMDSRRRVAHSLLRRAVFLNDKLDETGAQVLIISTEEEPVQKDNAEQSAS